MSQNNRNIYQVSDLISRCIFGKILAFMFDTLTIVPGIVLLGILPTFLLDWYFMGLNLRFGHIIELLIVGVCFYIALIVTLALLMLVELPAEMAVHWIFPKRRRD